MTKKRVRDQIGEIRVRALRESLAEGRTDVSDRRAIRNCGECLMNHVLVVRLDEAGVCPNCGADYGPWQPDELADGEDTDA